MRRCAPAAYKAGSSGAIVASPSTYRLNMQNTAAISTVSWISRSVAPAARAWATSSAVTWSPPCCTAAAIASKLFSWARTGALLASERTCSTTAMPPGSWAAAHAACDAEQYRHSFSADT